MLQLFEDIVPSTIGECFFLQLIGAQQGISGLDPERSIPFWASDTAQTHSYHFPNGLRRTPRTRTSHALRRWTRSEQPSLAGRWLRQLRGAESAPFWALLGSSRPVVTDVALDRGRSAGGWPGLPERRGSG